MECIQFQEEKRYIKDFLHLPKQIYKSDFNTENPKEVKSLLLGKHPLSKYFTLHKFLIYKNRKAAGRFVITVYENDSTAYLGFFECIKEEAVATFLFEQAQAYAKQIGCKSIVGPVDASFWIKYRLKINLFDKKPYTGEPANADYYYSYFLKNGYEVWQHYTSNRYAKVEDKIEIYDNRFQKFEDAGYRFVNPSMDEFDKIIGQLYVMITDLYSDFPIFKQVKEEDFRAVFSDYRYILDEKMVVMAYYEDKPVGFFVSVPNYGNAVYHLSNPFCLMKVLKIRKKATDYVMLYMGVDAQHRGMGKALVGKIMHTLQENGCSSIGALARDGKVTQNYGAELIEARYEYVLLKKEW